MASRNGAVDDEDLFTPGVEVSPLSEDATSGGRSWVAEEEEEEGLRSSSDIRASDTADDEALEEFFGLSVASGGEADLGLTGAWEIGGTLGASSWIPSPDKTASSSFSEVLSRCRMRSYWGKKIPTM